MSIETYIDNAIQEGKSITIKYIKYNGEISTRTLSDLQYSDEYGDGYIVGFCSLRHEMRTFKISRIKEVDGIKAITPQVSSAKPKTAYNPNSGGTGYTQPSRPSTYSSQTYSQFQSSGKHTSTGSYRQPSTSSGGSQRSSYYSTSNNRQNGGCYIATMVYGDYNHPQVQVLRSFRDQCLLTNHIGRLFVKFYYWVSPKLVRILYDKKSINAAIRFVLNKFIKNLLNRGL